MVVESLPRDGRESAGQFEDLVVQLPCERRRKKSALKLHASLLAMGRTRPH
jgi:hypothetical protein